MAKEDYVTAANIFVDATAKDYVSLFQQALDCTLDKTEESQRKLVAITSGKLQLEMNIKLRLLQSTRNVNYAFQLEPISVARIDILESNLKDQQEELERLRGDGGNTGTIYLYAESEVWASSALQWKPVNSDHFVLSKDKTSISVLRPGVYAFGVLVNHLPDEVHTGGSISLRKSNKLLQCAGTGSACYQSNYGSKYCSHATSTSLMCIAQVETNELISVVCTGTSPRVGAVSYLTVVRIGN
ncbi:unnamed protein product [Phytophthora fragariaefolia]|uniref:Unnamed protein product n=1 Tax=Phytophthora fragariaefolia TaxID=1490495 RepID=A0A9W7CYM9_9STRA|nr:unnamed protein product [Phytophthora fragariaefolia]